MADEYDYTKQWSGVYTPKRSYDEDGVYILNNEKSTGRNTEIYDEATRILYDDVHPRNSPGGRRYPGPYGAGRASDRNGPSLDERESTMYYNETRGDRPERFSGKPTSFEYDRGQYIQGSRRFGHPGPRGMITSSRENRAAVDNIDWDNRPPHYAPETPNKFAHLFVDPKARGPAITRPDPVYPGFRQIDKFGAGTTGTAETEQYAGTTEYAGTGQCTAADCPNKKKLDMMKVVLLLIIVSILSYLIAEWRITKKIVAAPPATPAGGPSL